MTAPTPEQMRDLAKRSPFGVDEQGWNHQMRVALRAAAYQLEAVHDVLGIYRGDNDVEAHWVIERIDAALSTDRTEKADA